jgi:hypothetical protein
MIDLVNATATRIHLSGGQFVRASEAIGEVSQNFDDPHLGGWIPVTDPGDGRSKLVRADRILWIEAEPDED